ncbi:hypothetical protein BGX38DRAFT_1333923 [Terfezia claveryi]|nr:hypothetical protein BGX38DRAFT_1333923 [Terfezia claveryi]
MVPDGETMALPTAAQRCTNSNSPNGLDSRQPLNLARGVPPIPAIDRQIKALLAERVDRETVIAQRPHEHPREREGRRQSGPAFQPRVRSRRTELKRHSLAAYTWIPANRDPFNYWLYHTGKELTFFPALPPQHGGGSPRGLKNHPEKFRLTRKEPSGSLLITPCGGRIIRVRAPGAQ